jgi:hypothetical protein
MYFLDVRCFYEVEHVNDRVRSCIIRTAGQVLDKMGTAVQTNEQPLPLIKVDINQYPGF